MLCRLAAVFVAVSAVAVAQAPPGFSDLHFPGGVPGGVDSLGKLVHVTDGGTLHVWSAFRRDWLQLPVGPGATTHQTNDVLLVRDGATWTAFGASRARFAPLPVTPGAALVNSTSRTNDSILLVRDGTALHAFSGFTGRWVTRTAAPGAAVDVQRHVALLADSTLLAAFDAFTGTWHDLPGAGPAVQLSTDGVAGVAVTATTVHGFSALHGTWNSAPALAAATLLRDDDWVVFHDGVQALGYSGCKGTFAATVTGPLASSGGEDHYGLFLTASAVHAYSSITGTWSQTALTPTATVRRTVAAALVVDAPQLVAYSVVHGTWVPVSLALSSVGEALAGTIIGVLPLVGAPVLFSSITGNWHTAPPGALPVLPAVANAAALLPTASGFYAFSARTGAFVPLVAPGSVGESNVNSAPVVAWDSSAVHFFDARVDRWVTAPRIGTGTPSVQIWRTSVLVMDSNELLGFGAQAGTVHRTPLPEPVSAFRANSESASIATFTHLFAMSALPLPVCLPQFPDFRRVLVTGAPLVLQLRLLQGDVALLGYGAVAPVPLPIVGLGNLLLEPSSIQTLFVLPEADAERAVFTATVPADPALRGASVWFQALVGPAVGAPYLTDASALWIG